MISGFFSNIFKQTSRKLDTTIMVLSQTKRSKSNITRRLFLTIDCGVKLKLLIFDVAVRSLAYAVLLIALRTFRAFRLRNKVRYKVLAPKLSFLRVKKWLPESSASKKSFFLATLALSYQYIKNHRPLKQVPNFFCFSETSR